MAALIWRWRMARWVIPVVAILLWFGGSKYVPAYILPPLPDLIKKVVAVFIDSELRAALLVTLGRVAIGLISSFIIGLVIGIVTGTSRTWTDLVLPTVRFIQGIPSLSWVVIAVIWFKSTEIRIWFIMSVVTLPGFALQVNDAYRSIDRGLLNMARSFRPQRWSLVRNVIWPAIVPGIFTSWKIQAGLGVRVVLVAELVGASTGVGVELLSAQQLFDMTSVMGWTLALALVLVLFLAILGGLERYALRYRPDLRLAPQEKSNAGSEQ